MKYKLKSHISDTGYPITDKNYPVCHLFANRKEIDKFGLKNFHKVQGLFLHNSHELLGTNTIRGSIYISSIVPKSEREEVYFHECQERRCLKQRRHL